MLRKVYRISVLVASLELVRRAISPPNLAGAFLTV